MKKKLLSLLSVSVIIFIASCNKESLEIEKPHDLQGREKIASIQTNPLAAGMSAYDVLGYGYDVTGLYANAHSAGFQVIDVDRLKQDFPARVIEENPMSQHYVDEYGENAEQYSKSVSNNISATANFKLFGAGISTSFNSSNEQSSSFDAKYIYGSYNLLIKQHRYRINADVNLLKSYLTPEFVYDLEHKTIEQLIVDYGTHVMLDIYTGGKLELIYQSETKNQDRTEAARIGIKVGVKAGFNIDVEGSSSLDISASNKNYSRKLAYRTIGGDPTKGLLGEINLDMSTPNVNFSTWQASVTPTNSVLVDFGENSLIPIYELIENITKKNALISAVNQYIANGEVENIYSKSPVYSLYYAGIGNPKGENHVLSLFPNDESGQYINEGILFYAYQFQKPGTIPVYRYRNEHDNNNFYTKNLSTYAGYNYEGAVFYAYPTLNATSEYEVKPVYRYWSDYHSNHYYTPNYGSYYRYIYERIEFYVPK